MSGGFEDLRATKSFQRPAAPTAGEDARFYLIVVEGGTSSMFHLPRTGAVVIGRGAEADLRLSDESASRRHARIMISDGEARVMDLESHNGTRVNGEPIGGAQTLVSGDVISICAATLVLHGASRAAEGCPVVDRALFRRRLEEELDRALHYQRSLTVAALSLSAAADRDEVAQIAHDRLRLIDVVAWAGEAQLVVLLPELDGESAREAVSMVVAGLPAARGGVATFPVDGCDADTLLAAAREAAGGAPEGTVAAAAEGQTSLDVGDRRIVVADPAMARLYALIRRLASSDLPVLILGETGVGKENAAFAVHAWSSRVKRPFVTLNCAAIQESLVESELFGYEKGAFSGAAGSKQGLLESASSGTVFLDEVGELPPAVQAKLLRVLEVGRFTRLGDVKEREIDIRLVAATNRNLEDEVKAGRFRQDLYFRLGAATVVLPPLRERLREIPLLARTFLDAARLRASRPPLEISTESMQRLAQWRWPGNVRELRNLMEFAAATVSDGPLEPWHLPEKIGGEAPVTGEIVLTPSSGGAPMPSLPANEARFRPIGEELRELERQRMKEALLASGGVQRRAAELLHMPLRTFVMKFRQYGLKKP